MHIPKKYMVAGTVVALLLGILSIVETLYLAGDRVFHEVQHFTDEPSGLPIPVTLAGVRHTVDMATTIHDDVKIALAWELRDPQGGLVYSRNETVPRKGDRHFAFLPGIAGTYLLKVNYKHSVGFSMRRDRDQYTVTVRGNDRRILSPLMGRLLNWL